MRTRDEVFQSFGVSPYSAVGVHTDVQRMADRIAQQEARIAAVDAACLEVCRDNTPEAVGEPDPELGRYVCLNENGDELIDTDDPAHVVRRLFHLWGSVSEKLEESLSLTREPLSAASGEPVADWNTAIEAAAQACENRARSYTDLNDTSLRNEALKCASAIRMRIRADAAPVVPVVELDEWAIVDKNNVPARFRDNTDEASISRQDLDTLNPQFAPHRVMRVCLKEVDRG